MRFFLSRPWIIFGFLILASRGLLVLYLGAEAQLERWEYDVIAANVVSGAGHVYERSGFLYVAFAPPVWSYLLALLLSLPGSAEVNIRCLQALLCFGSTIVYASLARRMSGSAGVGVLAGLLVALQPSLLYYSVVKSDPLPLNILLLGLIVLASANLLLEPRPARAAALGLLLAVGVLSRGTPIVALPLVLVWLAVRWRRGAVIPLVMTAIVFVLSMAPWLIRNHRLLGRPLITTTAGENFWRGNHEGATGGVLDEDGGRITSLTPDNKALPAAIRGVLRDGTELDRQDAFRNEGLRFVRDAPGLAAHLFARKMRTFWWRIASDPRDYSVAASVLYEIIYRTELALALLGAFVLMRSPPGPRPGSDRLAAGFPLAVMVAIGLLQSAFYVQGRHRFMIEPLLLMFTASGSVTGMTGLTRRLRVSTTAGKTPSRSTFLDSPTRPDILPRGTS